MKSKKMELLLGYFILIVDSDSNSLTIRQKCKSQKMGFKEIKHTKFSEDQRVRNLCFPKN